MDFEQMLAILATAEARAGSAKDLAAQIGITPAYLSQIKAGERAPSDRVLDALGLERKTIYFIKENTDAPT